MKNLETPRKTGGVAWSDVGNDLSNGLGISQGSSKSCFKFSCSGLSSLPSG